MSSWLCPITVHSGATTDTMYLLVSALHVQAENTLYHSQSSVNLSLILWGTKN